MEKKKALKIFFNKREKKRKKKERKRTQSYLIFSQKLKKISVLRYLIGQRLNLLINNNK